MNIIKVDTCRSTNGLLKEWATQQSLEEGSILVCKEQTAGRGQAGASWESESGKNLTFSLIFYPEFLAIKNHFLLSKSIALGVKTVLDDYTGNISIKWPNDIYYKDKKIAGILIENNIMGEVIVQSVAGIGVNINQEIFRSDAPNPVSLKQITGKETDLAMLLEQIAGSILSFYKMLQEIETELITLLYHQALYRKEGFFPYKDANGIFYARIESVENDGFIHLINKEGEKRRYAFKEVSFTRE
ncbi:MAG: biotin--[acetyl-CoA-carboxylase] ligase [Dysgonamonadaceae bacterium]|jgi:BirA family biotin operon repressor/biotin-[acetyl-CoA-carboxylase] ligase|nr:biotin--[acetyl-CoA-carboxylase] ligase [Dysgonamonadaceae bacterium]